VKEESSPLLARGVSKTLYLGVIVYNPSREPVTLAVSEAASYLMEPDAPFQQQPTMSNNPDGEIYAGAGIRAVDNVLRGRRQQDFPAQLVIPPGKSQIRRTYFSAAFLGFSFVSGDSATTLSR